MLLRIRFRWLMPLLMTAVQVVFFAIAAVQERTTSRTSAGPVVIVRAAVLQEDETVTFQPMESPRPSTIVVASAVLNLPAMVGGVILTALFQKKSDAAMLGLSTLFVPLVWYPIGKWIDGQIAPVRAAKRRLLGQVAQWALRVLSALGLLTCFFGFHDDWEPSQSNLEFMPLALWCTWYLFCSFWGERRLRRLGNEEQRSERFDPA